MGVFGWLKNQLIEIIEWTDDTRSTLVWRFPHHNNEIKNGAKLLVREGQVAIFVSEGQLADVFKPGLYQLETQNLPILASLKGWAHGFRSPFRSEIYFVNTRQYLDMKWGTVSPVTLRDPDLGIVRLRAHGIYSIRVQPDRAEVFFRQIVGTDGHVTTQEIEGQLRAMLVASFTHAVGHIKVPFLDLAGQYQRIAEICQDEMAEEFAGYGLALTKFILQSVTLPEEVQKAIDQRSSMGAVGDMQKFTQYQAAQALRENAGQGGGGAGAQAMDLAVGLSMGQMMASSLGASVAAPLQRPAPGEGVAGRLRKLKQLKEEGLIDEETFAVKRDAILAEL